MSEALLYEQDVVFVDRRDDVRIIVSLPARFSLASRRDVSGDRREFACRLVNLSSKAIALATPVNGPLGERVILHVDQLGKIQGMIIRVLDRGFVIGVVAKQEERARLLDKIAWLDKHINYETPDVRKNKRIVPRYPYSTLILANGSVLTCFVIDMSVSGVAVSADIIPEIGMPLGVGRVVGRVVRHFAGGFAVQFIEPQPFEDLEERILDKRAEDKKTPARVKRSIL